MPKQIELSEINHQAYQGRPIDNSSFVGAAQQLVEAGAFIAERSAFKQLEQGVASLEQAYVNEKESDRLAFASVKDQLASGNLGDEDTRELQTQAVKLASKLRQGGSSLDYVTKLQVATKQAKMRAPWAADKLEATFQRYVGSEGASAIYSDYQASQKLQQQYQQQLLADASEMGLHPSDPYLEEKVMQGKSEAYKLNMRTKQLQAAGAEDELLSREVINTSYTAIDNQVESVASGIIAQYGSLDNIPTEQKAFYIQQLMQLQNNSRLSVESALTKRNILKTDKDHLNSMASSMGNKISMMLDVLNGKLSADVMKNGLAIAENKEMLDLYKTDPSLFKAVQLGKQLQGQSFQSQIFNNQTNSQLIKWIKGGEAPANPEDRARVVGKMSKIIADPEIEPEAANIIGSVIIDTLDRGVKSPGSLSSEDRDILIDSYRNPKAKQYFDSDPNAIPVLERAIQYKMYQELPSILKKRYSQEELKQVQASVATSGAVSFQPVQVAGGDFARAQIIASELNKAVAPKVNKTLQTWSAYSADVGAIKLNPYAKLRNVMQVIGASEVEITSSQTKPEAVESPVKGVQQTKVRRIVRDADGNFRDAE